MRTSLARPVLLTMTLLCALSLYALTPSPRATPSQIVNNPDAFAWQLFLELNHPAARNSRGIPDLSRPFGSDGVVVWQTWPRTDEVFLDKGVKPPSWDSPPTFSPFAAIEAKSRAFRSPQKAHLDDVFSAPLAPLRALDDKVPDFEDSSMNRDAFDFVVSNELYNIEGQERFHAAGLIINLPVAARETKAAWHLLSKTPITQMTSSDLAALRARYHTQEVSFPSGSYLYGLTGLHITSKDLPNWFWATFEHRDNPEPELPDNDHAGPPPDLKNTRWQYYRLRGTQVDFVDSTGQPTLLANTQMEAGFQQTASCITCHSRATIGSPRPAPSGVQKTANRLDFFERYRVLLRRNPSITADKAEQLLLYGHIGSPRPDWFLENRSRRAFTQLDFMWSLRNAKSKELASSLVEVK